MKKLVIFVGMLALMGLSQTVFSQITYLYGIRTNFRTITIDAKTIDCIVVGETVEYFPAQKVGLQAGDVIIAIDGQPANKENWSSLKSKATSTFSIKRPGNQNITLNIPGVPCLSSDYADESDYAWENITGHTNIYVAEKTLNIEPILIMSDPDVDFFRYETFDFELAGQNIMQQREIAPEIEKILTKKGLKRNRENPDILVFIEFYSDRRDQYVPPTQQISTRYGVMYNFYTKQVETKQFIQSQEAGNYNKVDYLSKLSISMADAKKISAGKTETALIWQADYEVLFKNQADHKIFANSIGSAMLAGFPFATQMICYNTHWYAGIIYDRKVVGKVIGVVPDSPADQAGIKAGDIILQSTWDGNANGSKKMFTKSFDKLLEEKNKKSNFSITYHLNHDNFALDRTSNSKLGDLTDFFIHPFYAMYVGCYNAFGISHGLKFEKDEFGKMKTQYIEIKRNKPLVFTVKGTDKKTRKIQVNPLKANAVLYKL